MLELMAESQKLFTERLIKHHELFLRSYNRQLARYYHLKDSGSNTPGLSRRCIADSFLYLCQQHLEYPDAWTMNLLFELYGLAYEVRCNDAGKLVIRSVNEYPAPAVFTAE